MPGGRDDDDDDDVGGPSGCGDSDRWPLGECAAQSGLGVGPPLVLEAFLDAGNLSDGDVSQLLGMSHTLESDHQLATLLERLADYGISRGSVYDRE